MTFFVWPLNRGYRRRDADAVPADDHDAAASQWAEDYSLGASAPFNGTVCVQQGRGKVQVIEVEPEYSIDFITSTPRPCREHRRLKIDGHCRLCARAVRR